MEDKAFTYELFRFLLEAACIRSRLFSTFVIYVSIQEEERQRAEHNKIELAKQEEERAQKAAAFQRIEAERLRQEREIQDKMMNLPEFGRAKYSFHPQGPG